MAFCARYIIYVDIISLTNTLGNLVLKLNFFPFLQVTIPESNVYAIKDKLSAEATTDDYETYNKKLVESKKLRILKTTGFPKFDMMLLGMGLDRWTRSFTLLMAL